MSVHEFLLNDKFVEFSSKVAALHEKKKELKLQWQKLQEQFKADIAAINQEAEDLNSEFEQWRTDSANAKAPVVQK